MTEYFFPVSNFKFLRTKGSSKWNTGSGCSVQNIKAAGFSWQRHFLFLFTEQDLKSCVLHFQVLLIIAVSQLVTILLGFSLVSQNCHSFTYQWADLSDKVTFTFKWLRSDLQRGGGSESVRWARLWCRVLGAARGHQRANARPAEKSLEWHREVGSAALARSPCAQLSAGVAWVSAELCLQVSEHSAGCLRLLLPDVPSWKQNMCKATLIFIYFSS